MEVIIESLANIAIRLSGFVIYGLLAMAILYFMGLGHENNQKGRGYDPDGMPPDPGSY